MRTAIAALVTAIAVLTPAIAVATLTDEKWAFARANPCPTTGYKRYYGCPGYELAYPACEPWASSMKWVTTTDKPAYDAKAKTYCACLKAPVEVFACTTRGCRALAVNCLRIRP